MMNYERKKVISESNTEKPEEPGRFKINSIIPETHTEKVKKKRREIKSIIPVMTGKKPEEPKERGKVISEGHAVKPEEPKERGKVISEMHAVKDKIIDSRDKIIPEIYTKVKKIAIPARNTGPDYEKEPGQMERTVASLVVAADGSGDHTSIQTAIDKLPSRGGVIYIKEGTYTIKAGITIPSHVSIKGAGYGTFIRVLPGAEYDGITVFSNEDIINGNDHIGIENLRININVTGKSTGDGISFTKVTDSLITGIWITSTVNYGILLGLCDTIIVSNSFIADCGDTGIYVYNSDYCIISSNQCNSNNTKGIFVSGSDYNNIIANQCSGQSLGIAVTDSDKCIITNNQCNSNTTTGIYLDTATYNNIIANQCHNNSDWGIIELNNNCDFNTISGNICSNNTSGQISTKGVKTLASNNIPGTEVYGTMRGDSTSSLVMAAQDTWYQFIGFDTDGDANNMTPDHTNDHITINKTGIYKLTLSVSIKSATATDFVIGTWKNNGATQLSEIAIQVTTIAGAKDITTSASSTVSLTAGDTIEVWAERTNGAEASKTLIFEHEVLTITLIEN